MLSYPPNFALWFVTGLTVCVSIVNPLNELRAITLRLITSFPNQKAVKQLPTIWRWRGSCNGNKRDHTHGRDPDTGELGALFNPRTQSWVEYFSWSRTGIEILPLTGVGRVTIAALKMNDPLVVGARAIWVVAKVHPPIK